jgi:DNA-binding LacI/PurR family transcriptional regulator
MKTIPATGNSGEAAATVRQIAALAGVSLMTVSRALRNQPRVAEATRRKILKIAERVGYRPDPEIAKLMHHLRRKVRPQFQSVIGGLTNWPTTGRPAYFQALLAGAERQARERGYGFREMRLSEEARSGERLQRMLRGQGVQGVMLLPQSPPTDLGALLDWSKFSVAAASLSVLGPEVNRVAPHHFDNTVRLCREVAKLGYRRIGLVIDAEQDVRAKRGFSAALLSFGRDEAAEAVAPLVWEGELARALVPWFERERPDAVVTTSEVRVRECARILKLKIPGRIGFASTSVAARKAGEAEIAGIDEMPEEIGAIAVDLLASMIERRVRGLPVSAAATLLAGRWCAGRSCPARRGGLREPAGS